MTQDDNQRIAPRFRTVKGGRFYFYTENSSLDCRIRDLSDSGAKVKIDGPFNFPEELIFEVVGHGAPSSYYKCDIAWQNGLDIGVRFNSHLARDRDGRFYEPAATVNANFVEIPVASKSL